MIINLFSTFDPCTGNLSINWLRTSMLLIIINIKFWNINNNLENYYINLLILIHKEIIILINLKGSSSIFISIFILIMFNNVLGLIPYIFTSSSHLSFSLSISLPIWVSFIIYGFINKTNNILIHIVPISTPTILIPIMVIIETTRNIIRPGSLAVRLSANIIAGHIIISLIGDQSNIILILIIIIIIIILIFELAVALIQSYVFITLTTLYSREL